MTKISAFTRNVIKDKYALITPEGYVTSAVPGWTGAVCQILISPAMGSNFTQMLATLNQHAKGKGNTGIHEYFVYVMEGTCRASVAGKQHALAAQSYAFIPPGTDFEFFSENGNCRLLVFQKVYVPLSGAATPHVVIGKSDDVQSQAFLGDPDAQLKVLLPDNPSFDMAVNIFTYQPGATLPYVECHIMQHGLLMLSGQGIYRLDADYHPVQAGDVIYMAPYCLQWFVAMGKTPASYIYYKDVNRDPMSPS